MILLETRLSAPMNTTATAELRSPTSEYSAVSPAAQRLFRLCRQLENWLRIIVYVELRTRKGSKPEKVPETTANQRL
jgi:hypothetical protein